MNILYLASKSPSRRYLLTEACIPFESIAQESSEDIGEWGTSLQDTVSAIALHKMERVVLPQGDEEDSMFILTADTMTQDRQGVIHGKPVDRADAYAKVGALRGGATTCTAFCLDKKIFRNGVWSTEQRHRQAVSATCIFDVPDECISVYFERQPLALQAAGALAIEGFGLVFLKEVHGSYSTIMGLPLYELRQALVDLRFFGSAFMMHN